MQIYKKLHHAFLQHQMSSIMGLMLSSGLTISDSLTQASKVVDNSHMAHAIDRTREDIAKGLIYMVLQAIGSSTILSAQGTGIKDFVLIGNLTLLPQCKEVFPSMEKLYHVHFRIPKYSEFCTAIGAALCFIQRYKAVHEIKVE